MAQLHGGRRDQLEISPNLWAASVLCVAGGHRPGRRSPDGGGAIREYQDIGIDTFIHVGLSAPGRSLSLAELVFPLLSLRKPNNVTPIRVNTGPFGETIGNEYRPQNRHRNHESH